MLNERLAEASQALKFLCGSLQCGFYTRKQLQRAAMYGNLPLCCRRTLRPGASRPSHLLHPCLSRLLLSGREENNSGAMTKPLAITFSLRVKFLQPMCCEESHGKL